MENERNTFLFVLRTNLWRRKNFRMSNFSQTWWFDEVLIKRRRYIRMNRFSTLEVNKLRTEWREKNEKFDLPLVYRNFRDPEQKLVGNRTNKVFRWAMENFSRFVRLQWRKFERAFLLENSTREIRFCSSKKKQQTRQRFSNDSKKLKENKFFFENEIESSKQYELRSCCQNDVRHRWNFHRWEFVSEFVDWDSVSSSREIVQKMVEQTKILKV